MDAASRLFIENGYGSTSIDAVAAAAGVSRKTVFNAVGGKISLLKLALDWAAAGDDEPVPLLDRSDMQSVGRHSEPDLVIAAWAQVVTGIGSRLAALSGVLTVAAGIDPKARRLRDDAQGQRLAGARRFVAHLADHGWLRPGLSADAATDIIWLLSDPGVYHRLVHERRWTTDRFQRWLQHTTAQQLLTERSQPEGAIDTAG